MSLDCTTAGKLTQLTSHRSSKTFIEKNLFSIKYRLTELNEDSSIGLFPRIFYPNENSRWNELGIWMHNKKISLSPTREWMVEPSLSTGDVLLACGYTTVNAKKQRWLEKGEGQKRLSIKKGIFKIPNSVWLTYFSSPPNNFLNPKYPHSSGENFWYPLTDLISPYHPLMSSSDV